jgi:hypothetical protein
MTENGRKVSTASRKMSVGCEGEKVSVSATTHVLVFCRNITANYEFDVTTHCGCSQMLSFGTAHRRFNVFWVAMWLFMCRGSRFNVFWVGMWLFMSRGSGG